MACDVCEQFKSEIEAATTMDMQQKLKSDFDDHLDKAVRYKTV